MRVAASARGEQALLFTARAEAAARGAAKEMMRAPLRYANATLPPSPYVTFMKR